MAGGILALDLGTTTGWAVAYPGEEPLHGSVHLYSVGGDGTFFAHFSMWLSDQITIHEPRMIAYEAPVLTTARTHFQTAFRLMGLAAVTEMVAHQREVRRVVPAHNQTVKKFAAGNGRANKADMIDAMRVRGWEPRDEHAADALGVLLWAEGKFSKARRGAGPLFGQPAA